VPVDILQVLVVHYTRVSYHHTRARASSEISMLTEICPAISTISPQYLTAVANERLPRLIVVFLSVPTTPKSRNRLPTAVTLSRVRAWQRYGKYVGRRTFGLASGNGETFNDAALRTIENCSRACRTSVVERRIGPTSLPARMFRWRDNRVRLRKAPRKHNRRSRPDLKLAITSVT